MKIWISRYALSDGITEHECDPPNERGQVFPGTPFASYYGFTLGKDAHASKEDAVKAAESQRKKKIASLRKQLAKLEAMTF